MIEQESVSCTDHTIFKVLTNNMKSEFTDLCTFFLSFDTAKPTRKDYAQVDCV